MTSNVKFPEMREQVITTLRSLADPEHQRTRWGVVRPGVNYYDDLSLNVHVLYDDCQVLPDPASTVGEVVLEQEVPALLALEDALDPMLDDLGDSPDDAYLADPRWSTVVAAARNALDVMTSALPGSA